MKKSRLNNTEPPRAVLFDAYGTLFDVYSVSLLAEQLFSGQGQALGVLWRDKQIEYSRLVTTSNDGAHYQPFWELTRAGLRYACQRLGLDLTQEREQQLMNQYRHLSGLLDHVISVDGIRKYKTHPAAYALGEQATGLKAHDIGFVSCNGWDALAATWYGYRTLWVNRYKLPFETLGTQPSHTGSSLRDVLTLLVH